ncbi:MAG TPA: hypothetical protein VMF06_21780 [Candidatus Limnocylindria bacterium]|jgi:hypothetical protein|nr:hypothetical protein [Candidatus Limnocylindria bacterium]
MQPIESLPSVDSVTSGPNLVVIAIIAALESAHYRHQLIHFFGSTAKWIFNKPSRDHEESDDEREKKILTFVDHTDTPAKGIKVRIGSKSVLLVPDETGVLLIEQKKACGQSCIVYDVYGRTLLQDTISCSSSPQKFVIIS